MRIFLYHYFRSKQKHKRTFESSFAKEKHLPNYSVRRLASPTPTVACAWFCHFHNPWAAIWHLLPCQSKWKATSVMTCLGSLWQEVIEEAWVITSLKAMGNYIRAWSFQEWISRICRFTFLFCETAPLRSAYNFYVRRRQICRKQKNEQDWRKENRYVSKAVTCRETRKGTLQARISLLEKIFFYCFLTFLTERSSGINPPCLHQ